MLRSDRLIIRPVSRSPHHVIYFLSSDSLLLPVATPSGHVIQAYFGSLVVFPFENQGAQLLVQVCSSSLFDVLVMLKVFVSFC